MAPRTRPTAALSTGSNGRGTRRGVPRRKNSSSTAAAAGTAPPQQPLPQLHQQTAGRPRAGSRAYDENGTIDEAALEDALEPPHPLREAADRVGREVELFAEKLDRWNTDRREGRISARAAAMGLVRDCRGIAAETVKRLRRSHGLQLERRVRSEVKRGIAGKRAVLEAEADDGDGMEIGGARVATTVEDLVEWQEELAVWELVEKLFLVHWPDADPERRLQDAKEAVQTTDGHRFAKQTPYWDEFLLGDALAQERFVVLKWLESTAERSGRDVEILEECLQENSEVGQGLLSQSWLFTREKIKGQKRLRIWDVPIESGLPDIKNSENDELLVTQLDPDAVTRQARTLEKSDVEYENAASKVCWYMIRRGVSTKKLIEWCEDKHEHWRALMMGAGSFGQDCGELEAQRGYLWRRMCYASAKNGFPGTYQRAVVGFYGGDYESVEAACTEWTDFTFARYNALLLSQYDRFLKENYASLLPVDLEFALASYAALNLNAEPEMSGWNTQLALMAGNTGTELDTATPFRLILAYLLGHNTKNLLLQQGLMLGKRVSERRLISDLIQPVDPSKIDDSAPLILDNLNSLRVLAHLLVIHQDLGLEIRADEKQGAIENVLAEYIDFLRLAGKKDLLPLYVSRLSKARGEETMARILVDIVHPGERSEQMKLMKAYDMDVIEVLARQFDFAMEHSKFGPTVPNSFSEISLLEDTDEPEWPGKRIRQGFMLQAVDFDEEIIINSMEWFLLIDGYWAMTFTALTDVCQCFLNFGRIGAANLLIKKLPVRRISYLKTLTMVGKQMDVMDDHEGSDDDTTPPLGRSMRPRVRNVMVNSRRALTPQKLKVHRDLLKKYARTYFELAQMITAMQGLDDWRSLERSYMDSQTTLDSSMSEEPNKENLRAALDNVTALVEPLLGNFLTDPKDDYEIETLEKIRHAYLPSIILGYHGALHCAGHLLSRQHLLQCMELATEVAESAALTQCFTATGRMGELVDAFARSSQAILRLNENLLMTGAKGRGKSRGRSGQTLGIWDVVQ